MGTVALGVAPRTHFAPVTIGALAVVSTRQINAEIGRFIDERIIAASQLIAELASEKIKATGDVVLTFGRSFLVEQVTLVSP